MVRHISAARPPRQRLGPNAEVATDSQRLALGSSQSSGVDAIPQGTLGLAIGARESGPSRWNRQERLDKIPQRIWTQRGGHDRSRYLAEEDQVSDVLLHAL
jgi:hypothetical protein